MKTNKLLSIMMMLVLALSAVVTFSSCSNDDEDGGDLVGTWYFTEIESGEEEYREITFKSNGTGTIYSKEIYRGETYEETSYFTWKTKDDVLYVNWSEEGETVKPVDPDDRSTWNEHCKYSISGKKLTLIYDFEEEDSEDDIVVLTRK